MSKFILRSAAEVQSEHNKSSTFLSLKEVDGVSYFELQPSHSKIERLLVASSSAKTEEGQGETAGQRAKPLAKSTVIPLLREKRDAEFWARIGNPAKERRETTLRKPDVKAQILVLEDTPFTVEVPQVGPYEPFTLKVLLSKPWAKGGVMVQCDANTLEYLSGVCTWEACNNDAKEPRRFRIPKEKRFDCDGLKGVSMLYTKDFEPKSLVAKRKSTGVSKRETKYFKLLGKDLDVEKARAAKWAQGAELSDDEASEASSGNESGGGIQEQQ